MDRLRPLSETDCYLRLYGRRDPTVSAVRVSGQAQPPPDASEESRRRAEERAELRRRARDGKEAA